MNFAASVILKALLLSAVGLFAGCSWLDPVNPFSAEESAQSVDVPEAAAAGDIEPASERSVIEVLWRVPGEPVDAYVLDYGFEENKLDRQVRVPVLELTKSDHPKHGPVFRYDLKGVPSDRAVYLSLRAENKHGMSSPSPVVRVEPGQQSVLP